MADDFVPRIGYTKEETYGTDPIQNHTFRFDISDADGHIAHIEKRIREAAQRSVHTIRSIAKLSIASMLNSPAEIQKSKDQLEQLIGERQ